MKYFQVKKDSDNFPLFARKNGSLKKVGFLVAHELKTEKELINLQVIPNKPNFLKQHFTEINVPKSKVYFFFGARFLTNL